MNNNSRIASGTPWMLMLAMASLLSGCATTAKYETMLQGWVGKDERALLQQWGPPTTKAALPNGTTAYTWMLNPRIPGYTNFDPITKTTYAIDRSHWCKTTFTTDRTQHIATWHWEGNRCRSR